MTELEPSIELPSDHVEQLAIAHIILLENQWDAKQFIELVRLDSASRVCGCRTCRNQARRLDEEVTEEMWRRHDIPAVDHEEEIVYELFIKKLLGTTSKNGNHLEDPEDNIGVGE